MTHKELVIYAAEWAKKKYPLVITELVSAAGEIPDVLAFRPEWSCLIECKTSRTDFLRDAKKPWRRVGCKSLGSFRLYCAPKGMIKHEELPEKWGLLEVAEDKTRLTVKPDDLPFHSLDEESCVLLSLLRRIGGGTEKCISVKVFTHETKNNATASFEIETEERTSCAVKQKGENKT